MPDSLDLERYPLDRPNTTEWQSLVDKCHEDLETSGMFNLEGFLPPNVAQAEAAGLVSKFASESFRHTREHNIYFDDSISELAADHPVLMRSYTSNDVLCGDQVTGYLIDRLYRWAPFSKFLAATMGKPALYTMDDTMAGLNVMSYREGQSLSWHFDRSEFTTTMLLQVSEAGGEFTYRTNLRDEDDPNYEGVTRLLLGEDPEIRSLTLSPGTLNVFRGKNTPHKVMPVLGTRARIIVVFAFFEDPKIRFTDEERIGFYGRAN